jgi:hypothetical protein
VDYTYQLQPDGTTTNVLLIAARYGDGTVASNTYTQVQPGTQPLLKHAVDPRVRGKATDIRWEYTTDIGSKLGTIARERGKTASRGHVLTFNKLNSATSG